MAPIPRRNRPRCSSPDPFYRSLSHFRSAFTRPTWEKVQVLFTGTVLARGRRTVAAALRATGHEHDRHFSRFHAVFSRARWSALELARRLLLLLVQAFVPEGGLTPGSTHEENPRFYAIPIIRIILY
jgi:hypothetical protein